MDFQLHPRLAADTIFVADWALCRVGLMNDARYPWLILVPRRNGLVELFDLTAEEQAALTTETAHAAKALKAITGAAKMNIGVLGNVVPQFHMHVVARKAEDFAWPGPVWGKGEAVPYEPAAREALIQTLVRSL
jgi:diadenosine tetraphosphate (Ap4A) HIT family hydrolase